MLRRLALGLILLVTSLSTHALGLGDIHVRSGLNQPLEAEIELLAVRPEEQDNISVSLASNEAFTQAGVERPFLLTSLYFRVLQKPDGKSYIRVFSQEPIREPFLNYLIEVNWPNGRLLKQYTVLLDPPTFVRAAPPAIKAPAVASKPVQAEPPAPVSEPAPAAETRPAPQTAGVTGAYTGTEYGPVQRTDTLWTLANQLRPDGSITTEQMMLALLKANPEAFLHKNINGLKSGYTLRIPDISEIAALSQADALREVRQQYARWGDIKSTRAAAAGTATAATSAAQETTAIETGEAAGGADHRLKLVAAGNGSASGSPGSASADLKQELTVATEALESSKLENEELRSRISDLEKQVEMMQGMITLKDENLAALQSKVGAEAAPDTAETAPPQTAAEETAGEEPAAAESPAPEEQTIEEPAPEQASAESGAAAQPETPALSGLLDNLPRDPMTLGMAGGALLLVLALTQVIRRRREISSIITAESGAFTHPAATPLMESAMQPETAQTALSNDGAAAASADPIGEADVYIAYEQYPQAENILKRAIADQPDRHDLKLKLLELYHLTRNSSAFLVHAEELYTALGGTGATIWDKVAAMGKDLAPGDPLFGGGEDFSTEIASAPEIDVTLPAAPEAAAALSTPPVQAAAQPADNALDFTLDFDTGDQSAAPLDVQGVAEYSLADLQLDTPAKPDQPDEMEVDFAKLDLGGEPVHAGSATSLDFDLGPATTPQADAGAEPDTALEFDTDVTTTDEVATKLDLARAYIDMGDAEGARSILDEVTQEGNAAQKAEAQKLMRQIA